MDERDMSPSLSSVDGKNIVHTSKKRHVHTTKGSTDLRGCKTELGNTMQCKELSKIKLFPWSTNLLKAIYQLGLHCVILCTRCESAFILQVSG